jgi:16S rRNA (cytosine967-C5)-methyltransferase
VDARLAAVHTLLEVSARRRSLDSALGALHGQVPESERSLWRELCYGVLRWYPRLVAFADALLGKPLKAKDEDLRIAILLGLYQLQETRVPAHAAVAETVALARRLNKPWGSGLVNAVLRRYQREQDSLVQQVMHNEVAATAHPDWLLTQFKSDWPDDWPALVEANNRRPPMVLRVNLARQGRDAYLKQLQAAGLAARPLAHAPCALQLAAAVDVQALPGFDTGAVSVQDGAAQLAASLLAPPPGARVLDACAAPGGKTAHLLESLGAAGDAAPRVTAVESSVPRTRLIEATLTRLGLAAQVITADAAAPGGWWDGEAFDRILLDAPCSGSGVIRRHPDIKLLRRPGDIEALAATQAALLAALWSLLKPGGMLLYATCSVLRREGEAVVQAFLAAQADAREAVIDAAWGRPAPVGRYVLTGEDDMDGFYYARLQKVAA